MKKRKIKRRRSALVDIINGVLSLFILAIIAVVAVLLYGAHAFYADGPVDKEATFYVEQGDGLNSVAVKLEDEGMISNSWIFRLATRALKVDTNIPHGEFAIPAHASMSDILKIITEGKPIEHTVTIPEGFTSWQVVQRLNEKELLTGEIDSIPPEGSLLPNTYNFRRGDDRNAILKEMEAAQSEALKDIWDKRDPDLPLESPRDLVTLASIVEKETGVPGERPQVAAVFVNRLNRGMRLQSDPTIIYGITHGEGPLGRGLKKSEIEAETPYNTYVIKGLPQGPIANPGLEAMKAVANPADSKDLYFVAAGASPSAGHLFAASYAEHRKNVAKYRAALKAAAEEEAAEAEAAKDALEEQQAHEAGDTTGN